MIQPKLFYISYIFFAFAIVFGIIIPSNLNIWIRFPIEIIILLVLIASLDHAWNQGKKELRNINQFPIN
jgi:hypothetical protein